MALDGRRAAFHLQALVPECGRTLDKQLQRVAFGGHEAQVVAEVRAKARIRNLNEEAEALRAQLATLEAEIAGNGGDVASLNDEAAGFRAQIRELFR